IEVLPRRSAEQDCAVVALCQHIQICCIDLKGDQPRFLKGVQA
ncbi:hypothetical protein MIMGU_mgv1a0235352mg, partial [Erythranthe guttata]